MNHYVVHRLVCYVAKNRLKNLLLSLIIFDKTCWCTKTLVFLQLRFSGHALGNSKRRHFPTFGDGWRQMASNGVNRRRMASVGVKWRQRRQIGVHGAKLASSSLNWRHRRQIDVIVAKLASSSPNWCQRCQIGVSVANLASLTLFNTM